MATNAKRTVLHAVKSNSAGSVDLALDAIAEEGRKAGDVRSHGIIRQGIALMRVAKSLYSDNVETRVANQMRARLAYVRGWNEGCGLDVGARLATDEASNAKQANKFGVWIKAGIAFENPETEAAPFVARLETALANTTFAGGYVSMQERILTVLRKMKPDYTKLNDKQLAQLVKPDPAAEKEKAEKADRDQKAKDTKEAAVKDAAATTVEAAIAGKVADFNVVFEYGKNLVLLAPTQTDATFNKRIAELARALMALAEDMRQAKEAAAAPEPAAPKSAAKAQAKAPRKASK